MEYAFEAAYERIMDATGVRTQVGLAAIFRVRQSSVSDAKNRGGGIPANWLVRLAEVYGLNPVWVKTGEGPRYMVASDDGIASAPNYAHAKASIDCLLAEITRLVAGCTIHITNAQGVAI